MTTSRVELAAGDVLQVRLPDGRIAHLWAHDCDHCSSLDVWTTTPGTAEHAVSERTGDKSRAPMSVMGSANGAQARLPEQVATVVLIWKDEHR